MNWKTLYKKLNKLFHFSSRTHILINLSTHNSFPKSQATREKFIFCFENSSKRYSRNFSYHSVVHLEMDIELCTWRKKKNLKILEIDPEKRSSPRFLHHIRVLVKYYESLSTTIETEEKRSFFPALNKYF